MDRLLTTSQRSYTRQYRGAQAATSDAGEWEMRSGSVDFGVLIAHFGSDTLSSDLPIYTIIIPSHHGRHASVQLVTARPRIGIYELANTFQSSLAELEGEPTVDYRWAVREIADMLVRLFHPMMPHLAEECWAALGHKTLVASEPWPRVEADLLVENTIPLPVQINGRKRGDVTVARNAANSEIESAVLALDAVKRALDGRPPKKVIAVPQRIVNVVA